MPWALKVQEEMKLRRVLAMAAQASSTLSSPFQEREVGTMNLFRVGPKLGDKKEPLFLGTKGLLLMFILDGHTYL